MILEIFLNFNYKEMRKLIYLLVSLLIILGMILWINISMVNSNDSSIYGSDLEFVNSLDFAYQNWLTKYNKLDDYHPETIMSREQASKFFSEFAKKELWKKPDSSKQCVFDDIDQADPTLKVSIIESCQLWLFKWSDWKFFPQRFITKAEALAVLIRAVVGMQSEDVSPRYYNYHKQAKDLWYTKVDLFNINKQVNRYEMSLIMFRASKEGKQWNENCKAGKLLECQSNNKTIENMNKWNQWISWSNLDSIESTKFWLSFDQAMDRKSVEQNMKIFPKKHFELSWKDDKNLELILPVAVLDSLDKEIEFIVNVTTEAKTLDWAYISQPIIKKFKTDWIAKLDFITPDWAITDLNKSITVRFTKPMVPLTNLDNQPKCPIVISPELKWKCVWITSSTFQYRPEWGFPVWWKYDIYIPNSIETMVGDKTVNDGKVTITTPDFKILWAPVNISKDDKFLITFNTEVDINKFKDNFMMNWFTNDQLNIWYYRPLINDKLGDEVKNVVSIFPKSWDWWYSNSYTYTIGKNMSSARWNVLLWIDSSKSVNINDLLLSYSPFVFLDSKTENKYHISNIRQSANNSIITSNNPMIYLHFNEEINLDNSLFKISQWDFELKYLNMTDCSTGQCKLIEDKKSVIIIIKSNNIISLNLQILTSKISNSNDINLDFYTKSSNKITNFSFLDYHRSCISFQNKMWNQNDIESNIKLSDFGKLYYLTEVNNYSNYPWCSYEKWKNKYLLTHRLNPSTSYEVTIGSWLIDEDNYQLDKDYLFKFTTNKPNNEDKHIEYLDYRDFILVPKDIQPLSIGIKTTNLDKILVEVCQWDFDVTKIWHITAKSCNTKMVNIKNLWFRTNFTVIDLNKVIDSDFSKNLIKVNISKVKEDKTDYEKNNESSYYGIDPYITYFRTDYNVVIKKWSNNKILWMTDFRTWDFLEDQIKLIKKYSDEAKYDLFGKFQWYVWKDEWTVGFTYDKDWLYNLSSQLNQYILIHLKNWEIFYMPTSYYYSYSQQTYTYINTDRPLYKVGDVVKIKWIVRNIDHDSVDKALGSVTLFIRDSRYQEIYSKTVPLSSNWSFEDEFQLKEDASLGNYSLTTNNDSIQFAVEEFEKPDFKVETDVDKGRYVYWESAWIKVNSQYYIWSPLANGQWTYSISAVDYRFDWWKTEWYFWWENDYYWFWYDKSFYGYSYPQTILLDKQFLLDSSWKVSLDIPLQNIDQENSKNKTYSVNIAITDPNTKKSISSSTSFNVLKSPLFVWMKLDKYYYAFWDSVWFDFVTVDTEWNKKWNQDIVLEIYKLDYEKNNDTYIYEEKEKLVFAQNLQTISDWTLKAQYKLLDTGKYRFEVKLTNWKYKTTKVIYVSWKDLMQPLEDDHTITILPSKEKFAIWDNAEFIIQSPYVWVKALISIEKLGWILDYQVIDITDYNQKLLVNIKKEYLPNVYLNAYIIRHIENAKDSLNQLKKVRDEMQSLEQKLFSWDVQDIMTYRCIVEYDMIVWYCIPPYSDKQYDKKSMERLSILRVQENQLLQDILPDYKIWEVNIKIDTDMVSLDSTVKTDKIEYLPWDQVKLTLSIKDSIWKPINWEATVAIVDQALLSLKSSSQKSLLDFFYSEKGKDVTSDFAMWNIIKRLEFIWSEDQNVYTQVGALEEEWAIFKSRWVMKNMAPESSELMSGLWADDKVDSAVSTNGMWWWGSENAIKVRTDFKDLAFYRWTIDVKNWVAQIIVPKLPDDLTTWSIDWFVFTDDTKVWNFNTNFKTKKDIALIPSIPRFFVAWDDAQVTAVVVNNTDSDVSIVPTLDMTHIKLTPNFSQPIVVKANSQKAIDRSAKVDWMSSHIDWNSYNTEIVMKVQAWSKLDAIKTTRNIIPYSTPEYTFTNWSTQDISYEEKIELPSNLDQSQWKLDISLWSSILTNLTDSIENIADVPYWSFYGMINSVQKWAILKSLYDSIKESDSFFKIKLQDYNGDMIELDSMIKEAIVRFKNFQQDDGWFSYSDDCYPTYWIKTCSDFNLTAEYLFTAKKLNNAGYITDKSMTSKALTYYKTELSKAINDAKIRWDIYDNIYPFFVLANYDEVWFIKQNLLSDYNNLDNLDKLRLIFVLKKIWWDSTRIAQLMQEIKNSTIIEARWTLIPGNENYRYWSDNLQATALWLKVFIMSWETEKLFVENFARWLVAMKNTDWSFGNYNDSSTVLEALIEYINYTWEFKDINFVWKSYLNWVVVLSGSFGMNNKFSLLEKSFGFNDNLKFWIGNPNSLGFEKDWIWRLYYDIGLRYFLPIEEIGPRDEWIIVNRNYYKYDEYMAQRKECPIVYYPYIIDYAYNWVYWESYWPQTCLSTDTTDLQYVNWGQRWDMLVWEIEIIVPHERNNVIVNDFIPAWAEIVNTNLDTTSSEVKDISWQSNNSRLWRWYDHIEIKNDRLVLYADRLPKWTYKYTYVLKLNHIGKYHHRPAVAEEMKKPEIWGRTGWGYFVIGE